MLRDIAHCIYEFYTIDNIIKYYSLVGNSDVPYTVAIGENFIYFMLDKTYVPINYFNNIKKSLLYNAYQYYYGYYDGEPLKNYAKKMLKIKKIHLRLI